MQVIIGTYDGSLAGWQAFRGDGGKSDDATAAEHPAVAHMRLIYAFQAHEGSVRACAVNTAGDMLATGGMDESIRIFNLRSHRAIGALVEHKHELTCLAFVGSTHLLSGDAGGTLIVWRCSDWLRLDSVRAHKAALAGVAVHPSGRIAVTVARDRSMALWDLTKVKVAHRSTLSSEPVGITWDAAGRAFLIHDSKSVNVHSSDSGAVTHALGGLPTDAGRILNVVLLSNASPTGADTLTVAAGCETGAIVVWSLSLRETVAEPIAPQRVWPHAHAVRVKAMALCAALPTALPVAPTSTVTPLASLSMVQALAEARSPVAHAGPYLITADSAANVCAWSIAAVLDKDEPELRPVMRIQVGDGTRPTVVAAVNMAPLASTAPAAAVADAADDRKAGVVERVKVKGKSVGKGAAGEAKLVKAGKRPKRPDADAAAAAAATEPATGTTATATAGSRKKPRRVAFAKDV